MKEQSKEVKLRPSLGLVSNNRKTWTEQVRESHQIVKV
jgi:hypothetical protein